MITSASSGIGAAAAAVFAELGAKVAIGYFHNQKGAEEVREGIARSAGGRSGTTRLLAAHAIACRVRRKRQRLRSNGSIGSDPALNLTLLPKAPRAGFPIVREDLSPGRPHLVIGQCDQNTVLSTGTRNRSDGCPFHLRGPLCYALLWASQQSTMA